MAKKQDRSRIESGMTRRAPRWTIAFLRALERTGKVRWAAEDAGVDFTTAYARRRAHAGFAAAWAEALERGRAERERARGEEMAGKVERLRKRRSRVPSPGSPAASPTSPPRTFRRTSSGGALKSASPLAEGGGADYVITNGQLRRVGPGRWSKRSEEALLAELAWSGNIRLGCRAAGVSPQALSKRRFNDHHLDAACDAAVEIARKRLAGLVVELANRTFDPDELPLGEHDGERQEVTVDQAIAILKLGAGRGAAASPAPVYEPYDPAEVAERLEKKMRILGLLHDQQGAGAADRG